MKKSLAIAAIALSVVSFKVFAHVTVKPAEVKTATYQNFVVGVPVEKDIPTTEIRLVIPEGVESVMPNLKPGWQIELKKSGEGEEEKVTEVIWKGGSIGAGFRDEFIFSAKTPASEGTLKWKAYQTYGDGSVVNWDMEPGTDGHGTGNTPYSSSKVMNTLTTATAANNNDLSVYALVAALISIVLSIGVLLMIRRKL